MLEYLKQEANLAFTENGAVTNASSLSDCLDLFATVGAMRHASDDEISARFLRAYAENPDLALKTAFYARDIRGGLGERRVFRTILRWLTEHGAASLRRNIAHIAEFGRWDDLLCLIGTPCEADAIACIKSQLDADLAAAETDSVSLLAKWLPSVNASAEETKRQAKTIARALGMTDAAYRKTLTALRAKIRILENNLREKDYTFDYEKQPGKAMLKYRKAFFRNDGERYAAFLGRVQKGVAKLHTETLLPYELIDRYIGGAHDNYIRSIDEAEKLALNATWSALPDYTNGENALAVVDTSGSMMWQTNPYPISVALSLGLYFAERCKGAFHGHFIEFSAMPKLIAIKGETFADRLRYIGSFCEVANTNLEAVFDLILRAAVKNSVPQEELPKTIYIISDMEFDGCVGGAGETNFAHAKQRFAAHGYALPNIVFWNAASRNRQQPVTMNEQGVALVSGCSPRIFRMVAAGNLSPYTVMLETLGSERYACIAA